MHVVAETAPLAHLREEARRHPAAEDDGEQLECVAVRVPDRIAAHAEDQVRLLRVLRVQRGPATCPAEARRPSRSPVGRGSMPPRSSSSRSPRPSSIRPPMPDDHPFRPVPRVEVRHEGLARRALDRLPRPEDVPAERLIRVQEPVVDVSDVALRRVEVDVHLLEDHALLLRRSRPRRTSSGGACRRGRRARCRASPTRSGRSSP